MQFNSTPLSVSKVGSVLKVRDSLSLIVSKIGKNLDFSKNADTGQVCMFGPSKKGALLCQNLHDMFRGKKIHRDIHKQNKSLPKNSKGI